MVDLKKSEIAFIEEIMAYPNGPGYVLDFSDNTMSEYFEDEFRLDIYQEKYAVRGTSKRNHLIAFLLEENAYLSAKVLRSLWEHREGIISRKTSVPVAPSPFGVPVEKKPNDEETKKKFYRILADIEGQSGATKADGIDRYTSNKTLDELVADIERDLSDNKPEVALDRLHTYCTKKIAHLLESRGIKCLKEEALHARFGKYRKILAQERKLQPFTDIAMQNAVGLFSKFNGIRNNHTLAHDNEILEPAEARYIFETVSAILVFVRAIEAGRYD